MNKDERVELALWAQSFESRLARMNRKLESVSHSPADLRHAAVDAAGGISFKDEYGNVIYRIARNEDTGLVTPEYVGGPDPATPSAPFVDYGGEVVKIQHSGLDIEGNEGPADYRRTIVFASQEPDFEAGPGTYAGRFYDIDGSMTHRLPGGAWFIAVQWETQSGKLSELSEVVEVEVPPLVDEELIQEGLDAAQERLDEARAEFEEMNRRREQEIENLYEVVLPELERTLNEAMRDLEERVGDADLGHLEEALEELNEVRLPAIEGTLADKADTSALGNLDATLRQAFGEADEAVLDSAVSTLQAYARDGNNLVYNGSFEHGWDGWAVTSGELVEDEDARSGDHVLLLGRDDANEYPRTSWTTTEQGRLYLAEYWAKKVVEGEDPSGLRLYYQVELRDGSIDGSYGVGEGGDTELIASEDMPLGEWVKVSALVEVEQEGATQVRFAPHVRRSDFRFHIDDMRVVDVTEARAAIAYADELPKVLHGTTAPSSEAPEGSTWFQHNGSLAGDVIGQWTRTDGEWASTPLDSETIANLDVGKLTAGSAALSDAVIQDLTAENGAFDRLDAREGWIGGVALQDDAVTARTVNVQELFGNTAVINEIFARVVRARLLEAEEALIGGTLLEDDAITTRHIVAETIKAAQLDVQEVFANEAVIDTIWSEVVRTGLLTAEEAIIGGALIENNSVTVDKLYGLEEIMTALLRAKKIEAGEIDGNAFRGQTFVGGTFEGAIVRGGRVETHAQADRGVKLNDSGIHAFDENGDQVVRITGEMGNDVRDLSAGNYLTGRFFTNGPGEPGVILNPDYGPDSNQGPGIWFSESGDVGAEHPAIWVDKSPDAWGDPQYNLVIRGKQFAHGRSRVQVQGGLQITDASGIASNGMLQGRYGAFSNLEVSGSEDSNFWNVTYFHGYGSGSVAMYVMGWLRNPGYWETSSTANVYMNSNWGTIGRISSRRAIKVNIKPAANDPENILKLDPKSWVDLGELKQEMEEAGLDPEEYITPDYGEGPKMDEAKVAEVLGGLPKRTIGLVAEDVVAAGLMEYTDWTQDEDTGQYRATGVAYDRIWITLIPVVRENRERIEAQEEAITELQTENEALQSRVDEMEARLARLEALLDE